MEILSADLVDRLRDALLRAGFSYDGVAGALGTFGAVGWFVACRTRASSSDHGASTCLRPPTTKAAPLESGTACARHEIFGVGTT